MRRTTFALAAALTLLAMHSPLKVKMIDTPGDRDFERTLAPRRHGKH